MLLNSDDVRWIVAAAVLLVAFPIGLLVRRTVLPRLAAAAALTESNVDDAVVGSLRRPIPFWSLLLGAAVASRVAALPPELLLLVDRVVQSLLILSLTAWVAEVTLLIMARGGEAGGAPLLTGVTRHVIRASIFVVGGLVVLSTLGISIAPILTTFGIGGLAVALGLQDTLSNLFAGFNITLARNIRVGDFVRLETGEEGYVEDIRWRSARIRTLPNNVVVIPNSRLAQSVVTNYDLPSRDLAVLVSLGVHYGSDLPRVERVTCEIARTVMRTVKGAVRDFEPFIRFHTFGESSIDFSVIMRAETFTDSYAVKHEFIKAITSRYAAEGIVIPYPIRALNLEQEGAQRMIAPAEMRAER